MRGLGWSLLRHRPADGLCQPVIVSIISAARASRLHDCSAKLRLRFDLGLSPFVPRHLLVILLLLILLLMLTLLTSFATLLLGLAPSFAFLGFPLSFTHGLAASRLATTFLCHQRPAPRTPMACALTVIALVHSPWIPCAMQAIRMNFKARAILKSITEAKPMFRGNPLAAIEH